MYFTKCESKSEIFVEALRNSARSINFRLKIYRYAKLPSLLYIFSTNLVNRIAIPVAG